MCEHAQEALALATGVGAPVNGAAEAPLVSGERALHLPPLTEHPRVPVALGPRAEVPRHLRPVRAARCALVTPRVDRDHRRADAQLFAGQAVVGFGIERGVGEHAVPRDAQGGQQQDRCELWGVVGGAGGDGGPGDEVRAGVAGDGQLGPRAGRVCAVGAGNEVPRRVPGIQPGGIDGNGRLGGDQAGVTRARNGAFEEIEERPPFNSRSWAYLRVE